MRIEHVTYMSVTLECNVNQSIPLDEHTILVGGETLDSRGCTSTNWEKLYCDLSPPYRNFDLPVDFSVWYGFSSTADLKQETVNNKFLLVNIVR